ncbi:hypothetical protein HPB47_019362 [Ixodes persulcatus]|uniref:Uncharacterized protein n=1 Tax=Ixodes persulcatus TaxID=34615 RepID=A0AC60QKL7_IXOPE|nr:hypothetical protein HPB47_019362 [Ixodes persulcatus]
MTSQEQGTLNATNPTLTNASLAYAEEAASLSGLKCPPEEIQADVNMIERDEDLTEVKDPTNALPLSSHYYAESTSDASEITFDMRDFQTVHSSKRRKRTLNLAPKIMAHTTTFPSALGNVVVFTPKDPTKQVTSFNSIRLTAELENIAPSSILQIRPNKALNVIAIDTRNLLTTAQLLKRETLLGVPMYAYEPRSKTHAVGVIKDVAKDITEEELRAQLKSTIKLAQLRRLGDSQTVRLTFVGSELPSHVAVGSELTAKKAERSDPRPLSQPSGKGDHGNPHIPPSLKRKVSRYELAAVESGEAVMKAAAPKSQRPPPTRRDQLGKSQTRCPGGSAPSRPQWVGEGGSSTAAAAFGAAGVGLSARLTHHATSTTTELAAILLALEAVQKGSTSGGK